MSDTKPSDLLPIIASLRAARLVGSSDDPHFTPLAGGVASDIWRVESGSNRLVVKRALAKLRVAADWQVPVSRNACEVAWMRAAAQIVPDNVPQILAHDEANGFFAMEYLDPAAHPVWKFELRDGRAEPAFAAKVGNAIGRIHGATVGAEQGAFNSSDVFRAIRLEPYLEATARQHPEIAPQIAVLVAQTLHNRHALVHGDVSPKNILCGPKGPVFLDAECAWVGDPAFDPAFCLNHLLLKCLWTPSAVSKFLSCYDALAETYLAQVTWEPADVIEARIAALLPALLLARIDGKSPVEYVTDEKQKAMARAFAIPLIEKSPARLAEISGLWQAVMKDAP